MTFYPKVGDPEADRAEVVGSVPIDEHDQN